MIHYKSLIRLTVNIYLIMDTMPPYFIEIDNQDFTYATFAECIAKGHILKDVHAQRCFKGISNISSGSKLINFSVQYEPYEGRYQVSFKGNNLELVFERGDPMIVTPAKMIEHLKKVTIYGQSLQIVKEFVQHVFNLAEPQENDLIMIYENNQGNWIPSKEKKPRKLESVILHEKFMEEVVSDIQEFINSEEWYQEMGIPYKRSYLLYGPPGTGKSSLAQALAGAVKYSICYLNCSDSISDFTLNYLLNKAPKKSIILLEDIDSIFSQRKNADHNNTVTFSGFLNAIDGVRSQEGRIIIMTTNYKEKLDPALLRPGRTDSAFYIGLATRHQIQKLTLRFFGREDLAKEFAGKLPEKQFSMSMVQGFLVKHRKNPQKILQRVDDLLNSDENISIEQFLNEINCQGCLNQFKIAECHTLAHAKNLPRIQLEKTTAKLSPLLTGRLFELIRVDRKTYIRSPEEIDKIVGQVTSNEELQRKLRQFAKENEYSTIYQVKDKLKEIEQQLTNKLQE